MRIKRKNSKKTKNAKTNKYEKMPNKKVNRQTRFFALQQFLQLVFARGYGQRRQKEKGNTCVRNEKKRREKQRQQMNKIHEQKDIQR